jgi:glycolate oxidase
MNNDIIAEFRQCLSQEAIVTQPEDLITYSYDGTPMLREMPKVVVFPTSTEEVATILRLASKNGTPVVTRGAGTGLSGESIPVPEGIVLCLARMNRILELDTDNLNP